MTVVSRMIDKGWGIQIEEVFEKLITQAIFKNVLQL
jgi:hypothetical protein